MAIKHSKKFGLVAMAALCAALGVSNSMQPSLALSNGGNIIALGVPLTENFDSLTTSGAWTDNVTIPGWFSSRTAFVAGTGSSNAGALYSFGAVGSSDRALGSVASGGTTTVLQAAKLTNNTGATISSLDVSYVGEQWRNGGNLTPHTLTFQYQVANAGAITLNTGTWTTVAPLSFTGPIATATAGLLDGNASANRTVKSARLTVTVNAGQEIWLRWQDPDDAGSDHGLAIDDFSVTANGVATDPAPTVLSTAPTNSATNVAINSVVTFNFSEPVNATASAFTIQCPNGTPVSFTRSGTPATSITLTPTANLPYGIVCTVTAIASQITDEDLNDPADQMASNFTFSFSTVAPPEDPAPTVIATAPVSNATGVAVGSNILINFSESVLAGPSAFAVQCGALRSFALSGSPGSSITLDPDANLPASTTCRVTVSASQVSDVDANDPFDLMAADYSFSFTTADPPLPGANVIINELDADTAGSDKAEFVELFDGGSGNTPLDGLVVVFFAGPDANVPANTHKSYAAFDLDGFTTDASGYFTLGNPGIPGVDLVFSPGEFGLLQNGADAVAIFAGNASDFPVGTPVTTSNLQEAIVYGTDDADDPVLLQLLNAGQEQVNENAAGSGTTQSNQRCENGSGGARNTFTYRQGVPTPDGENNLCPPPPPVPGSSVIVISQLYGGGGNVGATYRNDYVELFNRGTAPVDITGWSLQYASATGSGWDFNKQPLAGTIAPGQYYLISLASGGAPGAPLPMANISGGLINLGTASGKVALVDNFDALTGTCPKFSVHLQDLVGYGTTANCREGAAAAPGAPNNTTAILRKLGGATDTDQNGNDFAIGAPNPRQTAPIVELGPYVVSSDPRSNGIDAPRDATIQVIFTEPVDVVDPWFTISCASTGVHDSATQAGSGQSRYITPNVNFAAGEECTVTILKDQVHDQDTDDSAPGSDTMTANHSWSFVVASGTAPPYPASVHLTLGNPSGAIADIAQPNNYLMEKPEFSLSYDRDLGRPNWVSSHLSSEWFGTLARVDTFRADPEVPADWYRVQSFDFSGSGFDRGHMVPNADRDKETSIPINQATFLMTNMIAQAPDNNQGPWANFEAYLRDLAGATNEIYIVTGGVGIGGTGSNGGTTATIANGHVTVPARTWKVALVLPKDSGDDVSRVTCDTRTIAIDMPNTQGIRTTPWESFLTTVDAVEALTGYDLFSNLPLAYQACVEAGLNGVNPPLDTTPPTITCASPDGMWHAGNVELFCTASDSGSGLANAGDASFALGTSVVDDIEDANASTGTRMVCDVAGNCSTAGPIAGNRIDRKDPVITLITPPDGAWHAANVALSHTASDGGSGLANAADATFTLATSVVADIEDANASTGTRVVCDAVGNCATAGPIAGNKIDRKAPVITLITPPDGAWHAANVAFSHTASDNGSGLANGADATFTLTTSVAAGIENANASTGTRVVCDAVGNCATAGPIAGNKIDRKAPVITLVTPPDGAWHADNVALSHTASDGGSGLANAGDATFTLATTVPAGTENANASTDTRVVCDAVGNCATAGPIAGNKIDRRGPVITLITPADGATYKFNHPTIAEYSCGDGGSGPVTCVGSVPNGRAIDTWTKGVKTFTVVATDAAGNTATRTVTYTSSPGGKVRE